MEKYLPSQDLYGQIARLWILRGLAQPHETRRLSRTLEMTSVLESVGFNTDLIESAKSKPGQRRIIAKWIQDQKEVMEKKPPSMPEPLNRNLKFLGARFKLNTVELSILAVRCVAELEEKLGEAFAAFEGRTDCKIATLISAMILVPREKVARAISPDASLTSLRLIRHAEEIGNFNERVIPIAGLAKALLSPQKTVNTLLSFIVQTAPKPRLSATDFPHLAQHLETLLPYLANAVRERVPGVNILLHGEPGVGKTELARLMAQQLGLTLFEVMVEGRSGESLDPPSRQGSYRLLQGILERRRKSVILFDEMEDVMPYAGHSIFDSGERKSGQRKAWMNRLLETNPVPTIWISNRVSHVDTAFLRRFGYVLKIDSPPRSVRRKVIKERMAAFAPSDAFLDRSAEQRGLSPACVGAISKVLTTSATDASNLESRYDLIAQERLVVLGGSRRPARYTMPEHWQPEFINANVEPLSLVSRLRTMGRGSLLLYGPPGSGKTALAHWLAQSMDLPLLVKRASDLHTPWFGETEQLLGNMFREAHQDGAVLLLDEADSFLFDRRSAQKSWEVGHVNELLTQMECFNGYFVCATNFLEALDSAALRRFSIKIHFDWMRAEQIEFAFQETLKQLGISDVATGETLNQLRRVSPLSAGDFKAATQSVRLMHSVPNARDLLNALMEQCAARESPTKRIGFLS